MKVADQALPVALEFVHHGTPSQAFWVRVGEPVQTMLTPEGLRVWIGGGTPSLVVGASAGDYYLDEVTGCLYVLSM